MVGILGDFRSFGGMIFLGGGEGGRGIENWRFNWGEVNLHHLSPSFISLRKKSGKMSGERFETPASAIHHSMPAVVRHHGFCQGWHIVIQHLSGTSAHKGTLDPKTMEGDSGNQDVVRGEEVMLWMVSFSNYRSYHILSNISPLNGSSSHTPSNFSTVFGPHLWAQQSSTHSGPHVHWQLL